MWRVSSVLREVGLSVAPKVTAGRLAAANVRGTGVHSQAEAYAYGEAVDEVLAWATYMDGVKAWFADFQPEVLFTERRVTNRGMRLTGKIDLGIMYNGQPTVVDYKSGAGSPSHGLQVCGYVDLANNDPELARLAGGRPWRRAVLRLPGNNTYKWAGGEAFDQRDPFMWRSALALVQWRFDHGFLNYTDEAVLEAV